MRSEAKSWASPPAALVLVLGFLSGCKSKSPAEDKPASDTNAAAPSAGTAATAATPSAAAPGAAAAGLAGKCPAGRWSYDYSDQALETLMKNVAGAKVLKKEGSFICTVSEGAQGSVVC